MTKLKYFRAALAGTTAAVLLTGTARAAQFNIPAGDLASALNVYTAQTGVSLLISADNVRQAKTRGARGELTAEAALSHILAGTGFAARQESGVIAIVREPGKTSDASPLTRIAEAMPARAAASVETVVVTSSKIKGDIQTVPIAITALSQEQLTSRQIAGGPDLVKEVPNLTFSKTNFTGYNIEIRGIGTQAISVATDPAVAVAFNDIPFIRNHFFEQEFYDVEQVEVLRGPQGTLYGRNATAGVVNVISAKPTDQFEAMLSADWGNYHNRRYEGMVNIPIVDDRVDLRVAGEWTKRDGYSVNDLTGQPIDGRDLWSTRVTLGLQPSENLHTWLVWEHFQENDDRLRSGKQLCETAPPPTTIDGVPVPTSNVGTLGAGTFGILNADYLSQSCQPTSLYSKSAFEVPYGPSLPYVIALGAASIVNPYADPYASTTQSTNLRHIESALRPSYRAKNDTLELNTDYTITPALTLTSQTGYNQDFLWSTEDYNRFNTAPGIFLSRDGTTAPTSRFYADPNGMAFCGQNGCSPNFGDGSGGGPGAPCTDPSAQYSGCLAALVFCDPQLGCSDRLVGEDLSEERAWQFNQEFRLASNFSGPLNFSLGGNYLHYETEENYYVFINALSAFASEAGDAYGDRSTNDNSDCLHGIFGVGGYQNPNPRGGGGQPTNSCIYIDPNPIGSLNNKGHNYFLSENPYVLNSYAGFGEVNYNVTNDLKLTGGVRYTIDRKHFTDIASELIDQGYGLPFVGYVDQNWDRLTGRAVVNWTPKLDFTDQTLVYGSYAHGYKAGGANPPGASFPQLNGGFGQITSAVHPATFKPEYIDAFELGTKDTLLDGALTLNGDVFYYIYKGYQISRIVDRTSINDNFNVHVKGAELESTWEPVPGLKFSFAGGYEDGTLDKGNRSIDLMDRTAGVPGWMVVKPFPTQASNCILPDYVVAAMLATTTVAQGIATNLPYSEACQSAYITHVDPVTLNPYTAYPSTGTDLNHQTFPIASGYPGFDPLSVDPKAPAGVNAGLGLPPNNGEGFYKNLSGNQLPNAPHFTVSLSADYTMPVSPNWAATLHSDFYWQSQSWARVFNDRPYDKIRGYSNVNTALILTDASGWQVMGYVKNIFNTTAITGDFLNSDDSGLTTNIFLTDPRLYGLRVTKHFDGGSDFDVFSAASGKPPQIWLTLGGDLTAARGQGQSFAPDFIKANPDTSVLKNPTPGEVQQPKPFDFDQTANITYQPEESDWVFSGGIRFGRSSNHTNVHNQTNGTEIINLIFKYGHPLTTPQRGYVEEFSETNSNRSEAHAILDFAVGKEVGLGSLGSSVLNGGIRFAQFSSKQSVDMRAQPDIGFKYYPFPAYHITLHIMHYHSYHATGVASRNFHGVGPSLSWTGSMPFAGNTHDGEFAIDWGANASILFGKQKARVRHHETAHYRNVLSGFSSVYDYTTIDPPRARNVAVPNVGGSFGLSYHVQNFKFSAGYRADLFMNAMDTGIDARKTSSMLFHGPYASISIGLGD